MIKRLITEEQKNIIKGSKKFKGKKISELSNSQKNELIEIIAKKLNLL